MELEQNLNQDLEDFQKQLKQNLEVSQVRPILLSFTSSRVLCQHSYISIITAAESMQHRQAFKWPKARSGRFLGGKKRSNEEIKSDHLEIKSLLDQQIQSVQTDVETIECLIQAGKEDQSWPTNCCKSKDILKKIETSGNF